MSEQERRKPIHILLVEDDPDAIRTIWNMLHEKSRYDFQVDAVTRLPEALNRVASLPVDAVLLDLLLATHQDEMDAVAAINRANPQAAVVVLTTLEDEQAGLEALERGADDYLLKDEIGTRSLIRSLHYAVERKRYEAALSTSEAKYRALADLSPDAIVVSVDGKYAYANPAAVEMVGADSERQIIGQTLFEMTKSEAEAAQATLRHNGASRKQHPHTREVLWRTLDGSSINLEIISTPINWQGHEGELVLGRDITERKELDVTRAALLEQEQIARKEAERAVAVQRLFLGMVSHELRTPLASIKGFSSSMLATDVTFSLEEIKEFASIIDEEADRLTALINQLMDMVQVQAGVLRMEPRATTVREIVDSVIPQMMTLAEQHHLKVALPDDLPDIFADSLRIGQVLVNLVGNAAKFSPPNSVIRLSAQACDNAVKFQVKDAGSGIPETERDDVFDVFYQGATRGGRKPGSGLGLAICKGLVEGHGGHIWIETNDGPGTTIAFTLPLEPIITI
jgi:PAS domain S-box-containing protein